MFREEKNKRQRVKYQKQEAEKTEQQENNSEYLYSPEFLFISWLPNILQWYDEQGFVCLNPGATARRILYSLSIMDQVYDSDNNSHNNNSKKLAGMLSFADQFGSRRLLMKCLESINFNQNKVKTTLSFLDSRQANNLEEAVKKIELVSPTYLGSWFIFGPGPNQDFWANQSFWTNWVIQISQIIKENQLDAIIENSEMSFKVIACFNNDYGLGKTGGEHHHSIVKQWLKHVNGQYQDDAVECAMIWLMRAPEPLKTAWYNALHRASQQWNKERKLFSSINDKVKNNLPDDLCLLDNWLVDYVF